MTEQEIKELQERNNARAQQMKEQMGNKYVLHPDHVKRPRNAPSILTTWMKTR